VAAAQLFGVQNVPRSIKPTSNINNEDEHRKHKEKDNGERIQMEESKKHESLSRTIRKGYEP
jgi:hypothetical protein